MVHDLVEDGGCVGGAGGGGNDEEGDTGQGGCAAGRERGSDGSHGLGMRWAEAADSGESVLWIFRIRLRFNAEIRTREGDDLGEESVLKSGVLRR